jgi:hypothetical protein
MKDDVYYRIVFADIDGNILMLMSFCPETSYEEKDWKMASRKQFDNEEVAQNYCRQLAKANGKSTRGIPLIALD